MVDTSEFFAALGLSGVSAVIRALIMAVICFIVIRIIGKIFDKLLDKSKRIDKTVHGILRTAVKIALWALAIIIIASVLGIPTASLVAVISVAGLALSLSVQNILTNLFSGITLLITRPFGVGDLIDAGGQTGTVQSINMFYTVINTLDNRVVSLPNSSVASSTLVNYSREPLRRVDFTFNTSYDDATEDVKAAILEAAQADSRVKADPAPFIVLSQYKDSSIEYIVRLWCDNANYWDVYFSMNERVRESFAKHGIHMTYAHINVHMIEK